MVIINRMNSRGLPICYEVRSVVIKSISDWRLEIVRSRVDYELEEVKPTTTIDAIGNGRSSRVFIFLMFCQV